MNKLVSNGVRVIDATGKFVMTGLIFYTVNKNGYAKSEKLKLKLGSRLNPVTRIVLTLYFNSSYGDIPLHRKV
nr:hypothetical protein [Tanacetum cinerariifolium]